MTETEKIGLDLLRKYGRCLHHAEYLSQELDDAQDKTYNTERIKDLQQQRFTWTRRAEDLKQEIDLLAVRYFREKPLGG